MLHFINVVVNGPEPFDVGVKRRKLCLNVLVLLLQPLTLSAPCSDGDLAINDAPLCRITGKGSVFYRREDADTPQAEDALYRVEDIAAKTLEYMTAMEAAP